MAKTATDIWRADCLAQHPLFWPLRSNAHTFVTSHSRWPTLDELQQYLQSSGPPVVNSSGVPIRCVAQDPPSARFDRGYEPRIFLTGELQTRYQSWHDFFQVLVWRRFPATKAVLNQLHYQAAVPRSLSALASQRSPLENALTQFDECGAVIVSSRADLLELVRNFKWHTLFHEQRASVQQELKCVVFGHAIYEKALNPYIGLTAHCVLLHVKRDLLHASDDNLLQEVDRKVSHLFCDTQQLQSPQDFSPFPLLGYPGWHPDNHLESFYANHHYFRPGRQNKTGS